MECSPSATYSNVQFNDASQKFYQFPTKIIFLKMSHLSCLPGTLGQAVSRAGTIGQGWGVGGGMYRFHEPTGQKLGSEVSPGEEGSTQHRRAPRSAREGGHRAWCPQELAGLWLFPQSWIQHESVSGLQTEAPSDPPRVTHCALGADILKNALRGVKLRAWLSDPSVFLGPHPVTANSLDLFHPADQGCLHSHVTEVVSAVTESTEIVPKALCGSV